VTWQAVIPPCLCAVALLILYLTFTHAHPVRGICNNRSFPTTDRQLSLLHILRGSHRGGIPQCKLCWASCMFYPCILRCTPLLSFYSGKTLSWGSVRLINAFRGRNNRIDLNNEPRATYVTSVDAASLDSMGSPTRRYVLTLPSVEHGEERC
jgi:hypothetical protein